ncbi:septum site-determining protein MinC [Phenylobacterium sp.]|jgi:septum site-determining protein MinC|uniref:septum site-determining protein MinC n=1 Tax=Phenylobacterium sp. TaxID=1871053 RepID=UPI002E2FD4E2|nr:septum site-determining protein MinC [Phenylobacterium sp.]HEX3367011.1 septum site-determining protein MinC [Phenylobacterium sp.]
MPAQLYPRPDPVATSRLTSDADSGGLTLPMLRIRGRSVMALVITPEPPFTNWFAALDQQMRRSAGFFADRPVVVDLAAVLENIGRDAIPIALDGLEERGLRVIGTEGVGPTLLAGTRWARLPTSLQGRDVAQTPRGDPPAAVSAPSLLVDRPVRSGQSVVFEEGDIIVVGAVASGAEVIAGGSIHVYGALRGRALAGLRVGAGARIFCRRLEAELVGVDQLYRTAEHWGPDLHGRAVQVRCDRGALQLSALD